MHWEDTPPRQAVSAGAVLAPSGPVPFRVSILRVPEGDPLAPAFVEFWRRALAEGPAGCRGRWEVLLFQMNLLGGGFTCVFTGPELERDEPPVFKFSSEALEAECYALPEREPGDPRAESEYRALEGRCLDQLRLAARAGAVAGTLRALRDRRAIEVVACDFCRTRRWALGV